MAKSAERRGRNGDPRIDGARQARREDILKVLAIRFAGEVKEVEAELKAELDAVIEDEGLKELFAYSLRCPDLFSFRKMLLPGSGSRAARVDPQVRREIIAEWVQRYLHKDLGLLEARFALEDERRDANAPWRRILEALEARFGPEARAVEPELKSRYWSEDGLKDGLLFAASVPVSRPFTRKSSPRSGRTSGAVQAGLTRSARRLGQRFSRCSGFALGVRPARLKLS
jgi:hypothetical protein